MLPAPWPSRNVLHFYRKDAADDGCTDFRELGFFGRLAGLKLPGVVWVRWEWGMRALGGAGEDPTNTGL